MTTFPDQPVSTIVNPGSKTIQNNATLVASGSSVFYGFGAGAVTIIIDVTVSPTGTTPTLQYTLQEIDPGDNTTVFGSTASSTVINAIGIQTVTLSGVKGGSIKVSWAVGGGTPSFTGVFATLGQGGASGGTSVDQGTAAALSGGWPVKMTDGTSVLGTGAAPVRTDPTGTTTQPVSLATAPLPSGAATAANQTTLGSQTTKINDGTSTVAVVGTALKVDGSAVVQPVIGIGVLNAGNSSTTPLANGATFTGTGVEVKDYAGIAIQVFTDRVSATDGMQLQWSQDNTNWDETLSFTLSASVAASYLVGPRARYFRVVLTNGGVTQTVLRLQTILHPVIPRHDTIRLADVPSGETDATIGKTAVMGKTTAGGGAFVDVKVSPSGALSVASTITDGTDTALVTPAGSLQVDGSGVTQPVSAASLPLPTGAATSANQTTLGNQTTKINDGTTTVAVTVGNALQVDASATTQPVSAASLPLPSGASTSANQTTVGSQTTKLNDGTNTAAVSAANALKVDGSAVTQPISGTVTANIGTSGALALDATLTGGTQKAIIRGGAKGSTTAADVTSTASGANHQPVDVAIYDAAGNQITSFGGGTQYTVNDPAPADPIGPTLVAERDDQLSTLSEVEGDWTQVRASAKGALWVTIPDTNGDPITSFGGGTQYVEDVAAPTDPTGTAKVMVRADTPATVATTDGDWVAQRSTNYGAGYVQVVTSAGAFVDTFGGGTQFADGAARGTATGTLAMVDDGALIQSAAGDTAGRQIIVGAAADAAAVAGNPLLVAGSDGTNARTIRTATDGTVRTDPTGTTTQPVSGTVTANIGTSGSLALDATLTGGTAEAIIRGGAKGATVAADITSTSEGVDHQAVDVQVYHGGTAVNPTAIRALTSSDVVTAAQGTAAALAGFWPVKVTDGTNSMPTMDTVGRRGFVTITDGTNSLPTGDAIARALFVRQTDGTNNATIKAANVTAVAADTGIVVAPRASATGTQTSVASSATSVQLLAANTARIGVIIFNDSTQVCFVKFGTTASATSFAYRLTANSTLEVPYGYTGRIDAIWASANGNARITEMT